MTLSFCFYYIGFVATRCFMAKPLQYLLQTSLFPPYIRYELCWKLKNPYLPSLTVRKMRIKKSSSKKIILIRIITYRQPFWFHNCRLQRDTEGPGCDHAGKGLLEHLLQVQERNGSRTTAGGIDHRRTGKSPAMEAGLSLLCAEFTFWRRSRCTRRKRPDRRRSHPRRPDRRRSRPMPPDPRRSRPMRP